MQLTDILSRVGMLPPLGDGLAEGATPGGTRKQLAGGRHLAGTGGAREANLGALLPSSGLSLGPPEVEDRLELSPVAHAILRAVDQLDQMQSERVAALRAGYLGEGLELEEELLAARLLHNAFSETAAHQGETAGV
jgi:hypothetical protein